MDAKIFSVDSTAAGARLDVFVARVWGEAGDVPALSRAHAQKLVSDGQVTVNGSPAKASARLKIHDRVAIHRPAVRAVGLMAENLPVEILFEDQDIIVINKAAGMVVHPAAGRVSGTLVNAILYHCPQIAGIGGERRPGVVHRLDKDTSGVMVMAKNDLAMASLVNQFKNRMVHKEYLALVHGRMTAERGEIDRAIGRHRSDRKRMSSLSVTGKSRPATTQWLVEERFAVASGARAVAWYSLLRLTPRTGRTHQIRVHLTDMGYPLLGDKVYRRGGQIKAASETSAAVEAFPRQALHAEKLCFDHVRSGVRLEYRAPLAEDMKTLIEALRRASATGDSLQGHRRVRG